MGSPEPHSALGFAMRASLAWKHIFSRSLCSHDTTSQLFTPVHVEIERPRERNSCTCKMCWCCRIHSSPKVFVMTWPGQSHARGSLPEAGTHCTLFVAPYSACLAQQQNPATLRQCQGAFAPVNESCWHQAYTWGHPRIFSAPPELLRPWEGHLCSIIGRCLQSPETPRLPYVLRPRYARYINLAFVSSSPVHASSFLRRLLIGTSYGRSE